MENDIVINRFRDWAEGNQQILWSRSNPGVVAEYLAIVPEKEVRQRILGLRAEIFEVLSILRQSQPRQQASLTEVEGPISGNISNVERVILHYVWERQGNSIPRDELNGLWKQICGKSEFPVQKFQERFVELGVGMIFNMPDGYLFLSSAHTGISTTGLRAMKRTRGNSNLPAIFSRLAAARPLAVDMREGWDLALIGKLNQMGKTSSEFIIQSESGIGHRCHTETEIPRGHIALLHRLKLSVHEADAVIHLLGRIGQPVSREELAALLNNPQSYTSATKLISLVRRKITNVGCSLATNFVDSEGMSRSEAQGYFLRAMSAVERGQWSEAHSSILKGEIRDEDPAGIDVEQEALELRKGAHGIALRGMSIPLVQTATVIAANAIPTTAVGERVPKLITSRDAPGIYGASGQHTVFGELEHRPELSSGSPEHDALRADRQSATRSAEPHLFRSPKASITGEPALIVIPETQALDPQEQVFDSSHTLEALLAYHRIGILELLTALNSYPGRDAKPIQFERLRGIVDGTQPCKRSTMEQLRSEIERLGREKLKQKVLTLDQRHRRARDKTG